MKKLLKKEITLTASPLSYIFPAFSLMTLIPGYPILVSAFFVCLGIFYTFQFAREYNDILFTALLPVKKSDVVKSKYVFTVSLQMVSLVVNILLTAIRMTALSGAAAYVNNPLMNANLAYLGYTLIVFALFNVVFVGGFFKTAYYFGKPFVAFCVAAFLVVGAAETLHHIPGLAGLNASSGGGLAPQGVVLGAVVFYIAGTFSSMRKSEKRFEEIDL